ncbi:MAG: NTP transferase domain-containing protein [Anaerolineales bacterium]|nr:NTP transferase domain-containing protein [Anaerolineales bacterium]
MLSIAILAGGQSRRMGEEKALTLLAGIPLIEHVLKQVDGLGNEIIIATNSPERLRYLGFRLVLDPIPEAGALRGLHSAIDAMQGDRALVVACDMPFINRQLLRHMIEVPSTADVVIPMCSNEYEPFHALYARSCLPAIQAAIQKSRRRMISFFPDVTVQAVEDDVISRYDPEHISFFNINTTEDLLRAEEIYRKLSQGRDT